MTKLWREKMRCAFIKRYQGHSANYVSQYFQIFRLPPSRIFFKTAKNKETSRCLETMDRHQTGTPR